MTSAPVPTLNSDGYGAFRVIGKNPGEWVDEKTEY